ncbi:MAG: site-specific integrase, partial [Candidatus Sumerlaeia bacterium]|nr:site-specific integrase [Candidatus Sumerlaeia bacterium]
HEREAGLSRELREIALGEFCAHYRESIAPGRKCEASRERDALALDLLTEFFGVDRMMHSIGETDLRAFQSWTGQPYEAVLRLVVRDPKGDASPVGERQKTRQRSAATVNRLRHTWSHVFTEAERARHIAENPWRRVEPLAVESHEPRFLTVAEAEAVLRAAEEYGAKWTTPDRARLHADYDPHNLRDMILWLLLEGTRRGEMFSLRWGDVDLEAAVARVRTLKLQSSKRPRVREIPLHPDVVAMLRARRARRHPTGGAVFNLDGSPALDAELVFPPVSNLRRMFQKCCARAKIAPARIHDLRHTTGTLLAASHSLTTVAAMLGHSSTRMAERYSHTALQTLREAVASLPRLRGSEGAV